MTGKIKEDKVAYTIDANKSFITKEGAVVYSVQGVLYRSSHNIFKPIKADVMSALKEVTGNTKNFNDKDNKTTPVSWASAKLTRALNAVGEQNLRYGIGLGGAGEEIKTVLNQQLANTKNTPLERNAIALAITSAGVRLYDVPNKPGILQIASKPKKDDAGSSSETYPMLQGDEVRELNIEDGVAGTIQNLRIGTNADRNVRVNPAEEETLYNRAFAHYTNPDNLRAVAAAYAQQIAAPGTVIQNGLTLAQADNVRDAI